MPHRRFTRRLLTAALMTLTAPIWAAPGYYRFPSIAGDTVAFTAEGDLWTASIAHGQARRLTTDIGQETQAAISPDGQHVAFVAQYESPSDVYVMPMHGGQPKRISFDAGKVDVHGWSPQGEVIYSSEDLSAPTLRRVIRLVNPNTLVTRELPLHDANQAAFDAQGRVLFTRFGAHVNGDNAKHYRGGAMAQLWLFDPASGQEAKRLGSDNDGAMHSPMWVAGRWYFVSNRDGHDNLWSMTAEGTDLQQHTQHGPWDVRSARTDGKRIVFQRAADVSLFDPATRSETVFAPELLSDFDRSRQRWLERPLRFLEAVNLSPKGDQLVLTARGKVTLASVGTKRRVDIATPAESRTREAILSHDGRWVYAINDSSGQDEIWRYAANGTEEARQLTRNGTHRRWKLFLSPNGQLLAHTDKRGALSVLNLATGSNTTIDRGEWGGDNPYSEIVWSPDSKAIVLVRANSSAKRNQLLLHRLGETGVHVVSSDRYASYAPAFSPDGRWLYFLSDRQFTASPASPWGDRNTGPGFDKRSKVYALALQAGTRFPFAPADELSPVKPNAGNAKKDSATKDNASNDLPAINVAQLAQRLYEVPLASGNYSALEVDAERLYLLDRDGMQRTLKTLAINNQGKSVETLTTHVQTFQLSPDRKRLAIMQRRGEADPSFLLLDATAKLPSELGNALVRVADWRLPIAPASEWQQMFNNAWRMHRDFSFDANMRGLDWAAVRQQYAPLLPRVTDRAELDDLLAQMISHLGILHSQVRGADMPEDREAGKPAMLGAAFEQTADGLRIARIYRSDTELPSERSPLAQTQVDARSGDIIEQVNGRPIQHAGDLANALQYQAGQQVLLTLRRNTQRIHTVVTPVDAARNAQLRYSDWVQDRIEVVEQAGQGRIGYLHLRAMGAADIASFVRDFYANIDRDGLVIDVRRNRGGNIDSWVIEKLLRRAWSFWQPAGQKPNWNMQQTFRGHLVVLTDALTYSDGETFAAGVKTLGLGPVVGTRTSGAGIWLSDRNRLTDGGIARIAETGQFRADGQWMIEGHGVEPDIVVDNLPHESYLGRDRQLETAIELLQKTLREAPTQQAPAQAIPAPHIPAADARRMSF